MDITVSDFPFKENLSVVNLLLHGPPPPAQPSFKPSSTNHIDPPKTG